MASRIESEPLHPQLESRQQCSRVQSLPVDIGWSIDIAKGPSLLRQRCL